MSDPLRMTPAETPFPPLYPGLERVSILFVDPSAADLYLPSLRTQYEVSAVSSYDQAVRALRSFQPTIVITELSLPDGDGVAVCCQAKVFADNPPSVLAMTDATDRVPDALSAGCDGVLLKPFAPNLLYARIGLLLKRRTAALLGNGKRASTNVVSRDRRCPTCGLGNVVAFDAASYRRMWYACMPCRKVWMAPREA